MHLRDLPRIARTLRPLRASQLVWRGRYALQRRLPAPRIAMRNVADHRDLSCSVGDTLPAVPVFHHPGATGCETVERLARGEFAHLNRVAMLGPPGSTDWQLGPRSEHRLWIITLHYHPWAYELAVASSEGRPTVADAASVGGMRPQCSDAGSVRHGIPTPSLHGVASDLFEQYLDDWMTRCDVAQPGARDLAWNSFAIATRIGWWVRSYLALGREWWDARPAFQARFLSSLWRQAEFLHGHPEWDLRGNHILRNAVGLSWAGRFFLGERPRTWLDAAATIALDQAAEQVLPDGGHFERSPMYHVHVMEDILALGLLLDDRAARIALQRTWEAMAEYLAWMRHPDGDIPLFNDAALGAVSTPAAMFAAGDKERYAASGEFRRGGRHFANTGMCVWHGDPWSVFFDVGDVGPDCQPGHAHADTLSIECSYRGKRLFVDPGTHSYDLNDIRRHDRGTASHNTVCIDGRDSSEVWHVFRVGARATPCDVRVDFTANELVAEAAHTGYDRLPGRPRPWRRTEVNNGGPLRITDRIGGSGTHTVTSGWLLGPGWKASAAADGWHIEGHGERLALRIAGPRELAHSIARAAYHPEYGTEIETQRLTWRYEGAAPIEFTTIIEPTP